MSESPTAAPAAASLNTEAGPAPIVGDTSAVAAGGQSPPLDAIICLPGINDSPGNRLLDTAERIATALDNAADTGGAIFSVATRDARTRNGAKLTSAAILRHETPDSPGREVLHLYEYDYRPRLNARVLARSPAMQAVSMALAVTFSFPSLWRALVGRRGTDLRQKLQTLWGVGLFMIVCLYLVLLTGSAIAATAKVGDELGDPGQTAASPASRPVQRPASARSDERPSAASAASAGAAPVQAGVLQDGTALLVAGAEGAWDAIESGAARVGDLAEDAAESGTLWLAAVVVPLIGAFTRFNLREALGRAAPMISSAGAYLMAGESRAEILGELSQVFNHLEEGGLKGRKYDQVHILAYSFGSVVAIDALFPVEAPASRRLQGVSTLMTVGCPYDFVRTYWPDYFRDRHAEPSGQPPRWINAYSPMDVLGSDFHDQPTLGDWFRSRRASETEGATLRQQVRAQTRRGIDLVDGRCVRPEGSDNLCWGAPEGRRLRFWDVATFMGFRAHEMYWSREVKSAFSCYGPLMNRLLVKDPAGILS